MSMGSVLVGVALLAVVTAYLARPFRRTAEAGVDRTIEAWVRQVQSGEGGQAGSSGIEERERPIRRETPPQAINYCPRCGRAVDEDDRFCSGCGTRLRGESM